MMEECVCHTLERCGVQCVHRTLEHVQYTVQCTEYYSCSTCTKFFNFKRGSVPPRCTLGSAVLVQFFPQERLELKRSGALPPSSSSFVCPLRLFSSSRSLGKTEPKLAVKESYNVTPEPQTPRINPCPPGCTWLHGPSLKK